MRILVTGIHTAAVREQTSRLKVRVTTHAYVKALIDLGHDVTWARTTPETEPTDYDLILCGMVPPGKIVSVDLFPIPVLLGRAKRAGVRTLFVNDDWQTTLRQTRMQALNYLRPERIIHNDYLWGRAYYNWVADEDHLERREWLYEGFRIIGEDQLDWIACAYDWGDPKILQSETARHVWCLDPSSYMDVPTLPELRWPAERLQRWSMSALADHSRWLGNDLQPGDWQIDYFTSRKTLRYEMPSRVVKQPPMRQDELLAQQAWYEGGILHPQPKRVGSGWWRWQWQGVPASGSVLWVDPQEAHDLPSIFKGTIEWLESLSRENRRAVARAQHDVIQSRIWPRERLQHELQKILDD